MAEVKTETADTLRGLALGETSVIEGLLGMQRENLEDSGLEPRAYAMVKLAALVALGGSPPSFMAQVSFALRVGVTPDEVLGVLVAAAPQVGIPRIVAAAPQLTAALGLPLEGIGS